MPDAAFFGALTGRPSFVPVSRDPAYSLSNNKIGPEGAAAVASALKDCGSLSWLWCVDQRPVLRPHPRVLTAPNHSRWGEPGRAPPSLSTNLIGVNGTRALEAALDGCASLRTMRYPVDPVDSVCSLRCERLA